ncbi:sialoadhesin-like [Salarias fasciatus]|uniref:sialoadhesin-like n=1 Tax=Salarias fasciatus TaxID=181472 RepID=UPI001176EB75|nr:sialoadhesin-like [Salarias fasciatus]
MFLLLSVFFLPAALVHCADNEAHLVITAPKKMVAMNGSCLMIPCSFGPASEEEFQNKRKIVAVWLKDDPHFKDHPERIVFNSSDAVNYPDISIIGDLKERNCTTKFNRFIQPLKYTMFFFRIENESFKVTAAFDPVEIKLKGSPPRPRLEVSGDLKDLKEKESVTITCSALTPCPHSPPQLTWSLQQDAHSQTEQNTDGTFSTQIQKNLTLSDTHDGLKIRCSAVYPVDGGKAVKTPETELTLNVSYAPKDTTASISPSGSWVTLTCSSRAKPAVSSFTWFKNSDHGAIRVSEGDFYTFNVADLTDPTNFYCLAENALGNQTSSWIHVIKADEQRFGLVFKTLMTLTLYCTIIIFECWFRWSLYCKQVKDSPEADYVNTQETSDH